MTRWSGLSQVECDRNIQAALWWRNLESLWKSRVGHQLELWPWPSSNWTHCLLFQPESWSDNPRSQLTTLASLPWQCAQLENQSRRPLRKRFANVCNYPVDFYTYTQGPYMGGGTSANSNGNGHDSPSDRCFEQRLWGKWQKWRKGMGSILGRIGNSKISRHEQGGFFWFIYELTFKVRSDKTKAKAEQLNIWISQ